MIRKCCFINLKRKKSSLVLKAIDFNKIDIEWTEQSEEVFGFDSWNNEWHKAL